MKDLSDNGPGAARDPRRSMSRECLLTIMDELPWVVSIWDTDARNVFVNRLYTEYLGRPPEDVHGLHIRDLVGEELYGHYAERIEAALRGERAVYQRVWTTPDGRERHTEAYFMPHVENGEIAGFVIAGGEITDRVMSQRALQEAARAMTLLQERQRMAEDLHDLVVQRLFAAGLDLAVALRGGPDAMDRVEAAAKTIDLGIRELRGTIHDLHQMMAAPQVPDRIAQIVRDSGRVLGFEPVLEVSVDWSQVPPPVATELTAVLNEALSNVVKHAQATHVAVTVAQHARHLVLRVSDDGRGVTDPGRRSGLSNMRRRAEKLGGTLVVGSMQPHGTVLEWSVPV